MISRPLILALILFVSALAQTRTTTAAMVPKGSITIDGSLDEYYWANDLVGEKIKIDNNLVTDGSIDGDADCYAQFKTLWNENGIYVGTWYYDDVHNAMNSQYLDAANIAYDDDGLEYFFDYNFDDAWNGTQSSNSLYNLALVKGFGNLDPSAQYGGWWGGDDGSGKGWSTGIASVPEQQTMGWHEVFTSQDGLNYTSELLIEWSGSIMHQQTGMSKGGAIAFDMKVNDNDGAFTIEGAMHWTGLTHASWSSYGTHWGKVNLGAVAGMRPVTAKMNSRSASPAKYASDIFGRRIASNKQNIGNRVLLAPGSQNGKSIRQIVLR